LAARLNAECLYLPAPIVCDSVEARKLLTNQPLFKEIRARAVLADMAIVSIGGLDSATVRRVGLVRDEDFNSVSAQGAVGNFLGFYIDDNAQVIDHCVNERIVGITGIEFKSIARRFMLSAGEKKVRALAAVLSQGLITDLVTNQDTALALLEIPAEHH
jgi:DNA-binding transcriptional regulator LsrR (DeoR family)